MWDCLLRDLDDLRMMFSVYIYTCNGGEGYSNCCFLYSPDVRFSCLSHVPVNAEETPNDGCLIVAVTVMVLCGNEGSTGTEVVAALNWWIMHQ